MSAFSETRKTLVALTKASRPGLAVHTTEPARFVPPAAFVGPGNPYETRDGQNYGMRRLNYVVTAVVGKGVNDHRADELDDLLEDLVDALLALEGSEDLPGLVVGDVGQPIGLNVNGQVYLSAPIAVSCDIER